MAVGALQDTATAGRVGRIGKYSIVFNVLLYSSRKIFSCKLFLSCRFSYMIVIINVVLIIFLSEIYLIENIMLRYYYCAGTTGGNPDYCLRYGKINIYVGIAN